MKSLKNESTRIYLRSGLLVLCSTAILYLVLSLVALLQKEVAHQGFMGTAVQLNNLVLDNPISIACFGACLVLFKIFVEPKAIAALGDRDSFLSQLGVIVVGFLLVTGFIGLVQISF